MPLDKLAPGEAQNALNAFRWMRSRERVRGEWVANALKGAASMVPLPEDVPNAALGALGIAGMAATPMSSLLPHIAPGIAQAVQNPPEASQYPLELAAMAVPVAGGAKMAATKAYQQTVPLEARMFLHNMLGGGRPFNLAAQPEFPAYVDAINSALTANLRTPPQYGTTSLREARANAARAYLPTVSTMQDRDAFGNVAGTLGPLVATGRMPRDLASAPLVMGAEATPEVADLPTLYARLAEKYNVRGIDPYAALGKYNVYLDPKTGQAHIWDLHKFYADVRLSNLPTYNPAKPPRTTPEIMKAIFDLTFPEQGGMVGKAGRKFTNNISDPLSVLAAYYGKPYEVTGSFPVSQDILKAHRTAVKDLAAQLIKMNLSRTDEFRPPYYNPIAPLLPYGYKPTPSEGIVQRYLKEMGKR